MLVNFPLNSNHTNEIEAHQYNQHNEIKEYGGINSNNITTMSMSPVPRWNANCSLSNNTTFNGTVANNTLMGQSFKSQPPKQVPRIPLLKSVDNNEMETVPK